MYNMTNLTLNIPSQVVVSEPCIGGFSSSLEVFTVIVNIIVFSIMFLYVKRTFNTRLDESFNPYFVVSTVFLLLTILNLILLYYRVFL